MNYHIVIAEERRSAPRELAAEIMSGVEGDTVTQLHSLGASIESVDDPQIIYAASWDEVSPVITVLKGSIADLNMQYAGWPMTEEAE